LKKKKLKEDDDELKDIFKNNQLRDDLETIHEKYIVVNADKAQNNIIIVCKILS
jgi:hypothetical protein